MSYDISKEWLSTDKSGDLLFFRDLKEVAKYFDLSYSEVYAISQF